MGPTKFDRIFEIPDQQLRTSLSNPSWISIDITDAATTPPPILELGQRTIKQELLYDDSVPFLWATWFELAPVKVETEAEAETRRGQELELARLVSENLQVKQQVLAEGTNDRLAVDDALARLRGRFEKGIGIP